MINFCDGGGWGGDVELEIRAWVYDETNRLIGYDEFYNGEHAAPANGFCHSNVGIESYSSNNQLVPWAIPPGQSHYWKVEMWEIDAIGNDKIGETTQLYVTPDSVHFYDAPVSCSGDCGTIWLDSPTLASSVFDDVYLPPVHVTEGQTPAYTHAFALDQYEFRLSGYSASNWSTDNSFYATVSGQGGNTGLVTGHNDGSTTYRATVNGTAGAGSVTVWPCDGDVCTESTSPVPIAP